MQWSALATEANLDTLPPQGERSLRHVLDVLDPRMAAGRFGHLRGRRTELRGDDIGGIGVHIGARIAAAAHPGEVLVSRTVTDLVAGSGIRFHDRGEHQLKGVPARGSCAVQD